VKHIPKIQWPNEDELHQLDIVVKDLDVEHTKLWFDYSGSWLNLDVWVHLKGERKFALWRSTGAVYPVSDESGAVGDDPILPAVWRDCPHCNHRVRVYTIDDEIGHMKTKHPDIVQKRLKFQ
jgi:hypothetical protein